MGQRILFACLSVFLFSSVNAQQIPLDTAVHTGVLANGFTYYIRYNKEPRDRVFLYLVNNVGSVLEDEDQQGLAHFMEHMNFNGTTHYPKNDLVDYLQKSGIRFGADLNAYTSFDETVYQLPIPANDPSILKNGFQIMRDWAQNATLDSIEINKERGVVLEEQRLGRGSSERMERIFFPVLLNQSIYAKRMPIGQVEILKNFNPSAIRRFHHDWYRPDLQALVVVGDVDVIKTEQLIKSLFADLKAPSNERPRKKYDAPLTGSNQFLVVTDPEMPNIELQVLIKHKEELLITETDYIRSMQRVLFNQMLNERLAALSQTPDLPFIEAQAGISGFMAGLNAFSVDIVLKEDKLKAGFQAVWEVIERIKRFGFTQSELMRAKQNYLRGMESSLNEKDKNNSANLVGEYQRLFLDKEASPGIVWEYEFVKNQIGTITLDQLNGLVKEYIKNIDRDILVLGPEKVKSSLPDSSAVALWIDETDHRNMEAFTDDVNDQPLLAVLPIAGKTVSSKFIKGTGVTELTLSNGLKVILKPTDFKNDEIQFAAFSPGGSSLYSDAEYQNARNAAMIGSFGLAGFNPVQLDKMLTGKIVQVETSMDDRNSTLEGYAAPKDFEDALQLIYLHFTAPRKDRVLFDNAINASKEMIRTRYSDPGNIFTDTVNLVLGNYNYRRTPPTIEKLNQLDLDKMATIYRNRFSDASGFTFVFVGNFNVDSIRPLLEKYLGSLPSTNERTVARDNGIHIPYGEFSKKVYGGTEDKATVKIVFSGDYAFSPENNLALAALKEVLAIKITQHLREDESEVYSPSVQVSYNKFPKNRYAFVVNFGCAPANADHLMDAVLKELAALRKNGPPAEDIEKFKAEFRRVQELNQTQNGFWLGYLTGQAQNQETPSALSDNYKLLNKLTPTYLKKAANLYLSGINTIKFELLPVSRN